MGYAPQYPDRPLKRIKRINGIQHKVCRGPNHPEGGAWVPLRDFYYHRGTHRNGKPFSRCINCENIPRLKNGPRRYSGLVSISRIRWIFRELERRLGKMETARRLGSSYNLFYRLGKNRYIQKQTVARAISLLRELREQDYFRSPQSIHRGAHLRGEEEKIGRSFYTNKPQSKSSS